MFTQTHVVCTLSSPLKLCLILVSGLEDDDEDGGTSKRKRGKKHRRAGADEDDEQGSSSKRKQKLSGLMADLDDDDRVSRAIEDRQTQRRIGALKAEMRTLLAQPVVSKYVNRNFITLNADVRQALDAQGRIQLGKLQR